VTAQHPGGVRLCKCLECKARRAEIMRAYRERHGNRSDWIRHRLVREAAKAFRAEHPDRYAALEAQLREQERARHA
jgi:hypothetical protein